MTSTEMKYEFLIKYDKVTSGSAPGYDDDEISFLLTFGQERVVNQKYGGYNKYKTSFEQSEKRKKDLSKLIRDVELLPSYYQTGNYDNGVFFELPNQVGNKCLYVISERVYISSSDDCIDGTWINNIKSIEHEYYGANIENVFKKPYSRKAWRIDRGYNPYTYSLIHEIIGDGTFTIDKYHIRYIKKPDPIIIVTAGSPYTIEGFNFLTNKDCELHESVHREIIDESVKYAAGITEEQLKYQIQKSEIRESE